MSVITLWSKVTVKAVWTPPLCQTNVSPRSWAWSAYRKGPVGLPVVTLHRARAYLSEPLELWAELQSLPRGPFHPGMCPCLQGDEKCPALLIKVYTISSLSLYQKDICGGIWPWWGIWVIWWWLWSFYLPSLSINSPGLQPLPPITWFQSSALDKRLKTSCQGGKIWPCHPGEEDSRWWGERSIFFFLPFHNAHGVLEWVAISFSSGPHSVRTLLYDPSISGGAARHGPQLHWVMQGPSPRGRDPCTLYGVAKSQTWPSNWTTATTLPQYGGSGAGSSSLCDFSGGTATLSLSSPVSKMETGASLVVYMVKKSPATRQLDPWVGKIPWRREWLPTPLFLPEEFHGQRSLVGCCQWRCKDSDLTEPLTLLKWKSLARQDPNQDERRHCTRVPSEQLMPALGLVTSAHGFLLCAPASDSLLSPSWKRSVACMC